MEFPLNHLNILSWPLDLVKSGVTVSHI